MLLFPGSQSDVVIGIPWSPSEFVKEAVRLGHPKHFLRHLPEPLEKTIKALQVTSLHEVAKDRTAEMRKWVLRASELKSKEKELKLSLDAHVKDILKIKRMMLFEEMLNEAGNLDIRLVKDICKGFDLMGPIAIDDLSESLINMTNSCDRTKAPMGVDTIVASLMFRLGNRPHQKLCAKTVDLRKTYKNPPLSAAALNESFMCVKNPETGFLEAFQSLGQGQQ